MFTVRVDISFCTGSCLSKSNGDVCHEIAASLLSLQTREQWRRCSPQNSQHCRRVLLAGQHASRHWVFRHTILVWPRRTDCRGSHSCGHRICQLDHWYLDLGGDSEGTGIIPHRGTYLHVGGQGGGVT